MILTALLSLALADDACEGGRLLTQDSLGHCCWDGQAWNGSACVGLPLSCPAGSRVQTWSQSCVTEACPAGHENIDGLHCCWPSQSWDATTERCAGTPTCPPGYGPLGEEDCIAAGSIGGLIGAKGTPRPTLDPARQGDCPAGEQLAADDLHCCPPGQGWSSTRGRCVGDTASTLTPVSTSSAPVPASGGNGAKGAGAATGGDPVILGALDKALIDAVIKRNMSQIRYCYQRELVQHPGIQGTIVVKFVIAQDGTVASAATKSSTMNSPAVESCLNARFLRFQFPEPKGGGIVIVSYPFVFEPS